MSGPNYVLEMIEGMTRAEISSYALRLAARVTELEGENDALKMGHDEGNEILAEMKRAISGLAGEILTPCQPPCCGHFGERGNALFKKGIGAYDASRAEVDNG